MPSAIQPYVVIPSQSITNAQLAPNSVANSNLQSASISGTAVAAQSILQGDLALNSVGNQQIIPNSISNNLLQSAVISGNVIAAQSILPGHILGGLQANRNKIINGDFAVWQRLSGNGFNCSNASQKKNYTADRWNLNVVNGNGIWQVFREQGLHPYFINFNGYNDTGYTMKIVCSGSDTMGDARAPNTDGTRLVTFQTVIENSDLMEFNNGINKAIIASLWVRSSKTGYIDMFMRPYSSDFVPNNGLGRGAFGYFTVNKINTWEYKQIVFYSSTGSFVGSLFNDANAIAVNPTLSGIAFGLTLQCGNQYQLQGSSGRVGIINDNGKSNGGIQIGSSGNSFNTAGDYIYLSNMQLEVIPYGATEQLTGTGGAGGEIVSGTAATPFETIPYAQQLAKCQRYFNVIGSKTATNEPFMLAFCDNGGASASTARGTPYFPTMRTVPTITVNGVMSDYLYQTIVGGSLTNVTPATITQAASSIGYNTALMLITTASTITIGLGGILIASTANAQLKLNADY